MVTFVRLDRRRIPLDLTQETRNLTYDASSGSAVPHWSITEPAQNSPPRRGRPPFMTREYPITLPAARNTPGYNGVWQANPPNEPTRDATLPTLSTLHTLYTLPTMLPPPPPSSSLAAASPSMPVLGPRVPLTGERVPLPSFQAVISETKKRKRDDNDEGEEEEEEEGDEPLTLPPLRSFPSSTSPSSPGASSSTGLTSNPSRSPNATTTSSPASQRRRTTPPVNEGRACSYRRTPTQEFRALWDQTQSQRFYVVSRKRGGTPQWPEEMIEVADSVGGVHNVRVNEVPSCDCNEAQYESHCKHLIYVLSKVLHARYDLVYQIALVSPELREIFINAPPIDPPVDAKYDNAKRKDVEGECPICFDELNKDSSEELVWCRLSCGQNFHKACFDNWVRVRGRHTCPLCRGKWASDNGVTGNGPNVANGANQSYPNHGERWLYSEWRGKLPDLYVDDMLC
ncbi:hypothetical protein PT974_05937 [Cladobotryum mycophilum]|uniref:RING-type domain-containing protein n=1 Tax=Cladobotryum mycophilum TaxID=491253 RepID=A0ABR0SLF0_9HYPO